MTATTGHPNGAERNRSVAADVRVTLRVLGGLVIVAGIIMTAVSATWLDAKALGLYIAAVPAGLALIGIGTALPYAPNLSRFQTGGVLTLIAAILLIGAAIQWWGGDGFWFFITLGVGGLACSFLAPDVRREFHGLSLLGTFLAAVGLLLATASLEWWGRNGIWVYGAMILAGVLCAKFGPGLVQRPREFGDNRR